jgi:hypothetical protein
MVGAIGVIMLLNYINRKNRDIFGWPLISSHRSKYGVGLGGEEIN